MNDLDVKKANDSVPLPTSDFARKIGSEIEIIAPSVAEAITVSAIGIRVEITTTRFVSCLQLASERVPANKEVSISYHPISTTMEIICGDGMGTMMAACLTGMMGTGALSLGFSLPSLTALRGLTILRAFPSSLFLRSATVPYK